MGDGNNTCQPKIITKTNKWLVHASGSRAFVSLDTLCEEFVCEEFVCEDRPENRTRVLVSLKLCGSTVDFIDDGLAKCVNRRRAARGMISAKCMILSPVFRTHFAMLQALHSFALLLGNIISNRYCC